MPSETCDDLTVRLLVRLHEASFWTMLELDQHQHPHQQQQKVGRTVEDNIGHTLHSAASDTIGKLKAKLQDIGRTFSDYTMRSLIGGEARGAITATLLVSRRQMPSTTSRPSSRQSSACSWTTRSTSLCMSRCWVPLSSRRSKNLLHSRGLEHQPHSLSRRRMIGH